MFEKVLGRQETEKTAEDAPTRTAAVSTRHTRGKKEGVPAYQILDEEIKTFAGALILGWGR